MKKTVSLLLTACLLVGLLPVCPAFAAESDDPLPLVGYEAGQVLAFSADGQMEVLSYADENALREGLATLDADPAIVWYQPNYTYEATALSTSDPLASQQWALSNDGSFQMEENRNPYPVYDNPFSQPIAPGRWTMPDWFGLPGGRNRMWGMAFWQTGAAAATAVSGIDIGVEEAWKLSNGGSRSVTVALIDTGVDSTHEDLADILWTNPGEIPGNGLDDDGNGYVDDVNGWNFYNNSNRIYTSSTEDSHGTHGAGTILAASDNGKGIAGIASGCSVKLMVLKALGGLSGTGSTASIIRAIQYAEANGASICNLSLGNDTDDRALYRAIASSGMLFVAAAGNDGADTDRSPSYPASYPLDNILSVANLSYDGTLHYTSNYGAASVDLAAPGTYILSTTPGNTYSYMTGTSMSAPMVSAAAAMVYAQHSDLSLAGVKEVLLRSAQKLDALEGSVLSGGMLDLGAAMGYDISGLSVEEWSAAQSQSHTITLQIGSPYLTVDGVRSAIDSNGTTPILLRNRTMLPIRAVMEAMGGEVDWDGATRVVTVRLDGKALRLQIGNPFAWDGGAFYPLDSPPVLWNDRTLLPVRVVVEYFGGTVEWQGDTGTVVVRY